MSAASEQLIDIAGLAERLGVGERFVRRLVDERRIPFVKVGRYVRFLPDDVERWINESRVETFQPFPVEGSRRQTREPRRRHRRASMTA